ncbi:MAG TPA: beta-galactosidase [Phycisphaerae bacterium]|nr:beta-galactosidase [Phycisphaerae bacterium]
MVGWVPLGLTLFALVASCGLAAGAEPGRPWSVDEAPFICGQLWIPPLRPHHKNVAVIRNEVRPGVTHVEGNFCWRYLEPKRDQWDFSSLEDVHKLTAAKGLKIVAFPWPQYAPPWFKETDDYVPLKELGTGHTVDLLSPWAPGTLTAMEHFYAGLKEHAGDKIDMISVGSPTSDFGEIGLVIAAPYFVSPNTPFPQDPKAWHQGLWCGDRYAVGHFRAWAMKRYAGLARLNAAWGTSFAGQDSIAFPDPAKRMDHRRWWIDFMLWYEASQVELAEKIVQIVRRHFPKMPLEAKLGFGDDNPRPALDRTAVCRAMAKYPPFLIRSTHAGGPNRGPFHRSYWFYKRMAPVSHYYGAAFGTEPPGGDLTVGELRQQMFEDASAGADYLFSYFQNYKLLPNTVAEFKRLLRPGERPLVDIGVLYPTSQLLLEMAPFPSEQIPFCSGGRDGFDYDVVDENMIEWGMLASYRVIIHTGGRVLEAGSLAALDGWLRAGGVLIVRGQDPLASVEGDGKVYAAWVAGSARRLAGERARCFQVGRGAVVSVTVPTIEKYLEAVVSVLAEGGLGLPDPAGLNGFDGKADGVWTTDFPARRLRFTTATGTTEVLPRRPK